MDARIERVREALTNGASMAHPLRNLAKSVNLSVSRLQHLFRSEMGISPGQFLKQVRLANAKALLETSDLSVKQVTSKVGLTDQTHFIREFKKSFGETLGSNSTDQVHVEEALASGSIHDAMVYGTYHADFWVGEEGRSDACWEQELEPKTK